MAQYGIYGNAAVEGMKAGSSARASSRRRSRRISNGSDDNQSFSPEEQEQISLNQAEQREKIRKSSLENRKLENEIASQEKFDDKYGERIDEINFNKYEDSYNDSRRDRRILELDKRQKYVAGEIANQVAKTNAEMTESNNALKMAENRKAELITAQEIYQLEENNILDRLSSTAEDVDFEQKKGYDLNNDGTISPEEAQAVVTVFPTTALEEWKGYVRFTDKSIDADKIVGAVSVMGGGAFVLYEDAGQQTLRHVMTEEKFLDVFSRGRGNESSDLVERYDEVGRIFKDKQAAVKSWRKDHFKNESAENLYHFNKLISHNANLADAEMVVQKDLEDVFSSQIQKDITERGKKLSFLKNIDTFSEFKNALLNGKHPEHGIAKKYVKSKGLESYFDVGFNKLNQIQEAKAVKDASSKNSTIKGTETKSYLETLPKLYELLSSENLTDEEKAQIKETIKTINTSLGVPQNSSSEDDDGVKGLSSK